MLAEPHSASESVDNRNDLITPAAKCNRPNDLTTVRARPDVAMASLWLAWPVALLAQTTILTATLGSAEAHTMRCSWADGRPRVVTPRVMPAVTNSHMCCL